MSILAKYGSPFPRQPVVPERGIVAKYGAPFPPRQQAVPGGQGDDPAQVAYDRGLVEGRRQILTWVKEAIDHLFRWPGIATPMGHVLIEGFRRQVDKYILSGGNPLEKDGGQFDDGR
jgi:hypothetical protein